MEILANIIAFLHLFFVIFVVVTPFITSNTAVGSISAESGNTTVSSISAESGNTLILLFYCFIVFSVMFHWITNNHGCVLTLIESKLRNKQPTQTFMGRLISPVYKISRLEVRLITLALFLYAFYKSHIWDPIVFYKTINLFSLQYKIFINKFNDQILPGVSTLPVIPVQIPLNEHTQTDVDDQTFHPQPV
jgi:hypothetical protein